VRGELERSGQERREAPATLTAPRLARFGVRTHVESDRRTLVVVGELDLASAPKLARAVSAALRAGARRLILDLRRLEFIDASGLHAVVAARDLCREEGCEFALVPGPRQVQLVFELTGTLSSLRFSSPTEAERR
jgi:anti-anti-sigma factor